MLFSPHYKIILPILLIVTIIVAFAYYYTAESSMPHTIEAQEKLTLSCDEANTTIPVERVVNITYEWIHSVERTPIIEVYVVRNGSLVLVEARSQSFGAGHPYSSEEIGGSGFRVEDGYMVYTANYTIGDSLEILGHPDYNGTITVFLDGGARVVCTQFVHAKISIGDP